MTAATIQPSLKEGLHTSSKRTKSPVIIFLHTRMRSIQYFLFALCVFMLLGTVLYFGIKDIRHQGKPKIETDNEIFPDSKEFQKNEENLEFQKSKPVVENPTKEKTGKKEEQQEITEEEDVNKCDESTEGVKYTEKEGEIKTSEGAVLLKSAFKKMVCVMGELSPYSVSCCGTLSLSDDGSDDRPACLIMDSYETPFTEDKRSYRLRFIMGKELVIYEEVNGFPKPGNKSYPLQQIPGKEICVSINFVSLDNDFTDVNGYKTCTFMNFGYGSEKSSSNSSSGQLLGYAENVKCDIDKETIIKKSLRTPFSVVIRLKLECEKTESIKPGENTNTLGETKPDIKETEIEDGDKSPTLPHQNTEAEKKPVIINLLNDQDKSQTEIIQTHYEVNSSGEPVSVSESSESFSDDGLQFGSPPGLVSDQDGVSSVFNKILEFIRNHILNIFNMHASNF